MAKKMSIRYDRYPSDEFLDLFRRGNLLSVLCEKHILSAKPFRERLDFQFREGDQAMLYWGLTRVLVAKLEKDSISFSKTSPTYIKTCSPFFRNWSLKEPPQQFREECLKYLQAVATEVSPSNMKKEGLVHAQWASLAQTTSPLAAWIPIDREAVLGYPEKEERRSRVLNNRFAQEAVNAVDILIKDKKWAKVPKLKEHNEVDGLAVSLDGRRLFLIEMKSGKDSSSYYAPLQIARYFAEWQHAFNSFGSDIVNGLNKLMAAKKELGLLAKSAPEVADPGFIELVPVLVFGDYLPSREVEKRFDLVDKCISDRLNQAGLPFAKIERWWWPRRGQPTRLP